MAPTMKPLVQIIMLIKGGLPSSSKKPLKLSSSSPLLSSLQLFSCWYLISAIISQEIIAIAAIIANRRCTKTWLCHHRCYHHNHCCSRTWHWMVGKGYTDPDSHWIRHVCENMILSSLRGEYPLILSSMTRVTACAIMALSLSFSKLCSSWN